MVSAVAAHGECCIRGRLVAVEAAVGCLLGRQSVIGHPLAVDQWPVRGQSVIDERAGAGRAEVGEEELHRQIERGQASGEVEGRRGEVGHGGAARAAAEGLVRAPSCKWSTDR